MDHTDSKRLRRRMLTGIALLFIAAALLVGGIATYAWFTSSQRVNTSRATARTGDEAVELQISSRGGADFLPSSVADIAQVNDTSAGYLMPVSTADLRSFVIGSAYNESGMPTNYMPVENEANYYHGRVYLRAVGSGLSDSSRVALYLDQTEAAGGVLVRKDSAESLLLNAARLGLSMQGAAPVIFYLSDETNPEGDRARNTVLNGELQPEGVVLDSSGSSVAAVTDPAVPLSAYSLSDGGALGAPIGYLVFDQIYALDIYFYLEGCDPDCCDSIFFDGSDLRLAFYGVLS